MKSLLRMSVSDAVETRFELLIGSWTVAPPTSFVSNWNFKSLNLQREICVLMNQDTQLNSILLIIIG